MKILLDYRETWCTTIFGYSENETNHKTYLTETGSEMNQFIERFSKTNRKNFKSCNKLYFGTLKSNSSLETVVDEQMMR